MFVSEIKYDGADDIMLACFLFPIWFRHTAFIMSMSWD